MLNHRPIILISLFISFNLLLGCQEQTAEPQATETSAAQPAIDHASNTTGSVIETIDAAGYTYVHVDVNEKKLWLAGPKTTISQGSMINVDTSSPMNNFHSKSLNRDFAVIYFVNKFSGDAVQNASDTASTTDLPAGHTAVAGMQTTAPKKITLDQPVDRAEGGQTIAEIISNKKELSGKSVKVRGKVTKFTGGIMNKNWIHIIDGSSENDLTVITDQVAEVGQMITAEGDVLLDKDFGYGYFYELLIENAKITVEH